jgi:hypothetical protein
MNVWVEMGTYWSYAKSEKCAKHPKAFPVLDQPHSCPGMFLSPQSSFCVFSSRLWATDEQRRMFVQVQQSTNRAVWDFVFVRVELDLGLRYDSHK